MSDDGFQPDSRGDASQLAAESVDELIDRRQVQSIFDARDSVRTVLSKGAELQAERPQVSDGRINHVLTQAVRGYLMELEQLLFQVQDDDAVELSADYWVGVDLGSLRVHPPDSELYRQAEEYRGEIVAFHNPPEATDGDGLQPARVPFQGLRSVLQARPPWRLTWAATVDRRHGDKTDVSHTIQRGFPRRVLLQAHRAANRFCADIGLGLDMAEEHEEIGFEYSDILDNPEDYQ